MLLTTLWLNLKKAAANISSVGGGGYYSAPAILKKDRRLKRITAVGRIIAKGVIPEKTSDEDKEAMMMFLMAIEADDRG